MHACYSHRPVWKGESDTGLLKLLSQEDKRVRKTYLLSMLSGQKDI